MTIKIALLITTYNRPELLRRCLDSLGAANLDALARVIVIDDASNDEAPLTLAEKHNWPVPLTTCRYGTNRGIKNALFVGYDMAFNELGCDWVVNLDPDAIVKPNFLTALIDLKTLYPGHIVSGFNCDNPNNPVLHEGATFVMRQHCNGINMLIDKGQYEAIVAPALARPGNWDYNTTNAQPFVITAPSVVQHIGAGKSTMGHKGGDVAADFKTDLDRVCLFGIDAHDPTGLLRAAEICEREIKFGARQIITERLFTGREAYSKFMIADLNSHLPPGDYTHVLIIHPDGYVQNPDAWRDEWLEYDYIGATWWYKDGMNNGNGGFCLRSRRLIEICSRLELPNFHPEDDVICRQLRPWLEAEFNIKFAPDEVCNRFSIEAYSVPRPWNAYSGQFGFHGYHTTGLPIPPPKRPITAALTKRR